MGQESEAEARGHRTEPPVNCLWSLPLMAESEQRKDAEDERDSDRVNAHVDSFSRERGWPNGDTAMAKRRRCALGRWS